MAGRWDQRDPWDDWDQDDAGGMGGAARRAPGAPGAPGRSSYQQRAYQPYQPYASVQRGAVYARSGVRGQPQAKKGGGAGPVVAVLIVLLAAAGVGGFLERHQILALLNRSTATPTTTAPALVLPAFSEWRVAYAGQDGKLHAVSLDGQTDVSGISLPGLSSPHALGTAATPSATATPAAPAIGGGATSPNGQYLAYVGSSGPVLLHLTAQADDKGAVTTGSTVPSASLWSSDSTHLAWLGTNGAVHITSIDTLKDASVPATTGQGITEILGWVDATHLAVRVDKAGSTNEQVEAVDTTNGQLRSIVTLPKTGYGTMRYALSPDGARFLAWNTPIKGQPFTAIFRSYDTKTGQARKLPNSLKALGTSIDAVAWKPGTATAAIASGAEATHDLKLWLVDAAADSATSIGVAYPLGWLFDGSQLIGSSAHVATLGGGPYTISAFKFPASGAPTQVKLTDNAMTFPWLGLVRTAA